MQTLVIARRIQDIYHGLGFDSGFIHPFCRLLTPLESHRSDTYDPSHLLHLIAQISTYSESIVILEVRILFTICYHREYHGRGHI